MTREKFLNIARKRVQLIDVPGWGETWIRTRSEVKIAQRASDMFDDKGDYVPDNAKYRRVWKLIDCVCVNAEGEPMFKESDRDMLLEMNGELFGTMVAMIDVFCNEEANDPKKTDASKDSKAD